MKLPKIFLTAIFTLLLQLTAVGQNLVVNPDLQNVFSDAIECLPLQSYSLENEPFYPNLSIIDLLMNEGPAATIVLKNSVR